MNDFLSDALTHAALPRPPLPAEVAARFAHVDTWVFDLDNTLYPAGSDLWPMIDERITRYLADFLGLDGLSARALQKFYYQRYGTTLKGLLEHHAVRHEDFLAFVHDIDRTRLARNPELVKAVASLPGRKLILTNGSHDHALRTTERLGFADTFEAVFDIVAADLLPKPDPATYARFFRAHDVDPRRAAMFEDIARNLVVPHARGMVTVLVVPRPSGKDHRDAADASGGAEPYVDFVTDDLAGFIGGIELARLGAV